MAGKKKTILDEVETIESAVAAELTESNHLNRTELPVKAAKGAEAPKTESEDKANKKNTSKKAAGTEKTAGTEKADKKAPAKRTTKTAKAEKTDTAEKPVKTTRTRKTAKTEKSEEVAEPVIVPEVTIPVTAVPEITAPEATPPEVVFIEAQPVDDDIADYIQPSSLEALKARYGTAEEDESIRSEGFELAKKSGLIRRAHPEESSFDYYAAPSAKDDIRTSVDPTLSEVFDATKSDFDADTVSFEDIATGEQPQVQAPSQPAVPVSQEAIRATGNRYGYDTHTTVIYVDESADDGIQRNSDDELNSAFVPDSNTHKRRRFPWLRRKK